MTDHGITHIVAEVSSHALDLRRVDDCAFDLGIFTNLTQDHLDYHRTMDNYFQAKKRFFSEVLPAGGKNRPQKMIINVDDPWGRRILREVARRDASPTASNPPVTSLRPLFIFPSKASRRRSFSAGKGFPSPPVSWEDSTSPTSLPPPRGLLLSASPESPSGKGLRRLIHVPGRLEKVSAAGQPAVFVDYAHTDDALRRVLQNLSLFRTGRIITVFGCGGDRDRGKRPLMGEAASAYSDLAIVTSDNPRTEDPLSIIREIETGIRTAKFTEAGDPARRPAVRGYLVIPDRKAAIAAAIGLADTKDIVLIAGKGHEDYQIIGTEKFPFDDRLIAREELTRRQVGREGP